MLVLAFDTAGTVASIAILNEQKLLYSNYSNDINKQSELLIPEIEKALRAQKIWYQDLDLIVATKGPGSFTGTRIGLAFARTLKISLNVPVILIDSRKVEGKRAEDIGLLGIKKFSTNKISKNLKPIYSTPPKITTRKNNAEK